MMLEKLLDIADRTIERLVPNKTAQEKIKQEFRLKFLELAVQDQDSLRKFFLEYEGRATEVPREVLWLRSLIRPLFTYTFGLLTAFWYLANFFGFIEKVPPQGLVNMTMITVGFWFGTRYFEKVKGMF